MSISLPRFLKNRRNQKSIYFSSVVLGMLIWCGMVGHANAQDASTAVGELKKDASLIKDVSAAVTPVAVGSVAFAGGSKIFKRVAFS
jgi:hypothetical protein